MLYKYNDSPLMNYKVLCIILYAQHDTWLVECCGLPEMKSSNKKKILLINCWYDL